MTELERLARQRGLTIKKCGQQGHVQILGGTCIVNYWPHSKKRSAHIEGSTERGRRGVTPQEAIEMAFQFDSKKIHSSRKSQSAHLDARKRTPSDWIALNPLLKYAFTPEEVTSNRSIPK